MKRSVSGTFSGAGKSSTYAGARIVVQSFLTALSLLVPAFFPVFFLGGCDSGANDGQVAESVAITSSGSLLARGQARTLGITVTAEDGGSISNPSVVWISSDADVLTVDENGRVQSMGRGTATVTATVDDVSDSIQLSVVDLEGIWEASVPDPAAPGGINVLTYDLSQSGLNISGTYSNLSGFPPITSTMSGPISGRLEIVGPTVRLDVTIRVSGPPCNIEWQNQLVVASNFMVLRPDTEFVPLTSNNCEIGSAMIRVGEVALVEDGG